MIRRIKWRWRLLEIACRLTYLEKQLESVPIFWNFQYLTLPEDTRKEIMGWMEETYELGIEEANILLNLKKYDLYKQVVQNIKLAHENICEVKFMCLQNGVSF